MDKLKALKIDSKLHHELEKIKKEDGISIKRLTEEAIRMLIKAKKKKT